MQTKRRWLKSVINAAAHEQVLLPWAVKRAQNSDDKIVPIIRIAPSAPVKYAAIAAS
jgi:hypothetical protein